MFRLPHEIQPLQVTDQSAHATRLPKQREGPDRSALENVSTSSNFLGRLATFILHGALVISRYTRDRITMDAQHYLKKHGWRGSGHSLDQSNRGLKKPLLVSKKVDVLGVGVNKHAAVSDQWWLRAFDQSLQTLGTGQETALSQAQKHGVNRGGLYGRFVKGEGVPGTIGQTILPTDKPSDQSSTKEHKKAISDNGMLPTPQDSDAQDEKADRKRKRSEKSDEKRSKRKKEVGEDKKGMSSESEAAKDKASKKAKKDAKKAKKAKKDKKSTSGSNAEDDLDPEKQALYAKRAAEKGVSLETYIKRRQEKYAAKKDEKRK